MYTIYSCKCGYYYQSAHNGICPHCGGKLEAECVSRAFYEAAEP